MLPRGGMRIEVVIMSILRDIFELTKLNPCRNTVDILGRESVCDFIWNDGVSISDINQFEQLNGIYIPSDYKDFLSYSNGADIFVCDDGNAGYHLFNLDELVSETKWLKEAYEFPDDNLVFMNMLYSTDFIMFDNINRKIVFGETAEQSDRWIKFSMDFDYLILRMVWSNGSPFWEWYY